MKIQLGDPDSERYFKFKIGDKVRSRYGPTTGTVIAGNCYVDPEGNIIYYTVKMRDGRTQIYRQGDIERLHIKLSQ